MTQSMPGVSSVRMGIAIVLGLALLGAAGESLAGPNAGGTLVVHDAGLTWSSDSTAPPVSSPPAECSLVDNEVAGGPPPANTIGYVWKIYAAFPPGSSPRLKALGMGESLSSGTIVLAGGPPDPLNDFEVAQDGWPSAHGGSVGVSFGAIKTAAINEVYWFAGYGYDAGEIFAIAPHVNPANRFFVDDTSPPLEDEIMGYSSLGFGAPGSTVCPGDLPPEGACCFPDGSCTFVAESACGTGDWREGVPCDPNPCPLPATGACCHPTGSCALTTQADCPWDDWRTGEPCDPNPCPQPPVGACCYDDGTCEALIEWLCVSSTWIEAPCTPNPCPNAQWGACCEVSGACSFVQPQDCYTGDWRLDVPCDPNPCPNLLGACCDPDGSCRYVQEHICLDGEWHAGESCTPNPCPQPLGACCSAIGECSYITEAECAGDDWMIDVPCSPNPCAPPPGQNSGGVLVVHDIGQAYTEDQTSYPSPVPAVCSEIDNSLPADAPVVWKIYAVFPEENQPRLKALAFGEDFDPSLVTVYAAGLPSPLDFEIPQNGWPTTPGGGIGISFAQVQTATINEVYWFGGYGHPDGIFDTTPHPVQASIFVDDLTPPTETPIAGFGSIGFGVAGDTPCEPPFPQACCSNVDGSCTLLLESECAAQDGAYFGGPCEPNPCPPPPTGACCFADGNCLALYLIECAGVWLGADTVCDPNPCPQPSGACCFADGHCTYVAQVNCSGNWLGFGTDCSPNPCPQPSGACCYPDGHCTFVTDAACPVTWLGPGTVCDPNPCPQPAGACCYLNGACTYVIESACPTGEWTMFTDCDPNPCPQPILNEGGVLVVHDAGTAYTDDQTSFPSDPPATCGATDNVAPPDSLTVWKVYAAFPEINQPRLKALAFGADFDPMLVHVLAGGPPSAEDSEIAQNGWPTAPGGGVEVNFGTTQTGHITEVYWLGGYAATGAFWDAVAHPAQPTVFVDDSVPANEELIAALGSIGFGVPGDTPCDVLLPGACCWSNGSCTLLTAEDCASQGGAYFGGPCDPSPCPPPAPQYACCVGPQCTIRTEDVCLALGGEWFAGEDCTPNPCPQPPPGEGDTIGDALLIPSLPFYDSRGTCSYTNDYDEICPYSGSTAQDLVYRYSPAAAEAISIDLCSSSYDTKVYVYENAAGNLIACNDDAGCGYSGWQSKLENVLLGAGNTYYIVIDGYGTSCGEYVLSIQDYAPCAVTCPDGAEIEGEPPCQDNYVDNYNGGCNTNAWMPIMASSAGCATLCGKSCTYSYQGLSYRDTDWYRVNAIGGTVTYSGMAEFPLTLILIYGLDCNNLGYLYTTAGPCQEATLSWPTSFDQEIWLWIGPQVFSGLPESDYVFDVCGILGGVIPVKELSWGQIKKTFFDEAKKAEREQAEAASASPGGTPAVAPAGGPTRPGVVGSSQDDRAVQRWSAKRPEKPGR